MVNTAEEQVVVYGFIVNFMNLIKYAIIHEPAYRAYIESRTFMDWQMTVLWYTMKRVRERVDIPDLKLLSVWIGRGHSSPCWVLPNRFRPDRITKDDAERLERLKEYFGNPALKPSSFYLYSSEEPEIMRNATLPDNFSNFDIARMIGEFDRDTKGVLRRLLGEEGNEA